MPSDAPAAEAMSTEKLSGAEIVLRALKDQGVEVIFGYPGGAVLPIYDALFQQNAIRHILVRHEQAAVHAAEGYARSTGKVGVVLVTSGPGATNAVTGLVDALMDSIPVVCLTGQVPTHLIGNDAFQEADTTGITRPATKHNYLVKNVADVGRVVHEAFYVARSGRPGPVVIDLPKDVLINKGSYLGMPVTEHRSYRPVTEPDPAAIQKAVAMMKAAKRPIIYAGGGVINAGPEASRLLTELVHLTGFPCTNTLMGLGAFPASDRQFLGMLGMHGTYEANLAMHGCDVMVNIGARFDDRVTGRLSAFSPNSLKIHADIDPSSINKNVRVDCPIIGDAASILRALIAAWKASEVRHDTGALAAWWKQIDEWRGRDCLRFRQATDDGAIIKPQYAIQRLYELSLTTGKDTFITTEVGQHQMWAAQYWKFEKPNRTLAQYRLPVKVFILNNEYMGMVRQWQELLHGGRYSESYSAALPDFVKLAESFHGVGLRATKVGELDDVIREMLAVDRPVIADICVDQKENCFPMIPSGAAHNEMLLGPDDEAPKGASKPGVTEEGMVLV